MKHASPATLDQLERLLAELRALPGLKEKGRGVFYRKGRAYLHFHEDPKGQFGDLRDAADLDFERFAVSGVTGQVLLLAAAATRLGL